MKSVTKGTGITERRYVRLSGKRGFVSTGGPNSAPPSSEHHFEAYLRSLQDYCSEILRRSGLPDHAGTFLWETKGWQEIRPEDQAKLPTPSKVSNLERYVIVRKRKAQDSDLGYAARLLTIIDRLRIYQRDARILDACVCAHEIGELNREWDLKIWDGPAITGKKRQVVAKRAAKRINASKSAATRNNQRIVKTAATEISKVNPKLTRRSLARNIKAKTGLKLKLSTIEGYLKNK